MKTNKRFYVVGALFAVLLGLLALLLTVQSKDTSTASAATNRSESLTVNGHVERTDGMVVTTDTSDQFIITMESERVSGWGSLNEYSTLNWSYVNIIVEVQGSSTSRNLFRILKDDEEYHKSEVRVQGRSALYSGALPDGDYTFYYRFSTTTLLTSEMYYVFHFTIDTTAPQYTLMSGGENISNGECTNKALTYSVYDASFQRLYYKKPNADSYSTITEPIYRVEATGVNNGWWEFYATDSFGLISEKVKVYLDCLPPRMQCSPGSEFDGTTGGNFTVSATDDFGTARLYVKFESEEWFYAGDSYSIPDTERNGRYYFYAVDEKGNRSETSWVILSTDDPVGSLKKSDTDNSYTFVWNNSYWSATLDGARYTEGRVIRNEGTHEIVLSNNADKTRRYTFTIDHCYKIVSQTAATCIANGVNLMECSQCGDRYEEVTYSGGHRYSVTSTPSSCTESEHIIYTCDLCGAKYETEGNYPSGHNYVSTITREPTCTQEGERCMTCERCGESYSVAIAANGHTYEIADTSSTDGKTIRAYTCTTCGDHYEVELGNQYEEVSGYIEYLFEQYSSYMWWVLLAVTGVWSIVIGVMIAIAQKHEEKEKAKKMLVNYAIGLVIIAVVLVACPYLMRGIAALIT